MEAIIFIGIQASGKSTFYKEKFFQTHVRINLDMLKTRHREKILLEACIAAKQPFVIDNTNPTVLEREMYIKKAIMAGFSVTGYYFQGNIVDAISRNEKRLKGECIPMVGIIGTHAKLQIPGLGEGFDSLYYVRIVDSKFMVEEWRE